MIIAVDARPLVTRQIGGAEQHARNIVSAWAKLKSPHRFLLLFDTSARENFDASLLGDLPENFEEVLISRFNFPQHWLLGSRVFSAVDRILRRHQVDVYHSFSPIVPFTTACPVVQTIHDLSFELDPAVRRAPGAAQLRRLTRHGVKWAQRIVTVSSQTKFDVAGVYQIPPDKIDVIYNGINPAFTPAHIPHVRVELQQLGAITPYILAVGADIPRRNYQRMFSAMQLVWKTRPEIRLTFAGRADWTNSPVYRLAQATGNLQRLSFVNAPTDVQLAQLYRDAIVTCCASSFEGFGLSVLESLACGTPVTCSDMRSLREVAENAAVYFAHDDPASMAQCIAGLIDDVEYRRQLKYRGVQRASLFTWPKTAELLLQLLEGLAPAATTA